MNDKHDLITEKVSISKKKKVNKYFVLQNT